MKILKILLLIAVVIFFTGLVIALMAPKKYSVERSAIIHANDSITHYYISNFQAWEKWSPWNEMDPSAQYSYAGLDGAVGASQSWEGDKTGTGSMTWTTVTPNNLAYEMAMVKPFPSASKGMFTLENVGQNQTKVTWQDGADISFGQRPIYYVMSMEKMLGPQFERGLFKMDSLATIAQNTMILNQNLPAEASAQ